jgi:hypothetical protein
VLDVIGGLTTDLGKIPRVRIAGAFPFHGRKSARFLPTGTNSLNVAHRFQFPERLTNTVVSDGVMMFVYAYDNTMWAIA